MEEYTIKRFGDYTVRVTINLDTVPIDNTLYTFQSKIRDVPATLEYIAGDFVPGGEITLAVTPVGASPADVDLVLTGTQTGTLTATTNEYDARRPLIDVRLTRISDGYVFFTDPGVVNIQDTSAHD